MRNIILLPILLILFCCATTAYSQTNLKTDDPLNQFLDTEFMQKYTEMRVAAETTTRTFKNQQGNYSPADLRRVELAYNRTAEKFNFVLRGIKEDMLDKRKLKYISRFPDDYQKELKLDMYELSDYYSQNYQQVLADVTNSEIDGIGVFLMINGIINSSAGLFQLVKGITNYIEKTKKMKRQFSEKRLEKLLIKPHVWPLWHELDNANNNSNYENENNYQNESQYDFTEDNPQFQYNPPSPSELKSKTQKEAEEAQARANIASAKADEAEAKARLENSNNENNGDYDNNGDYQDSPYDEGEEYRNEKNGNYSKDENSGRQLPPTTNGELSRIKKDSSPINIAIPTKSTTIKKVKKKKGN